MHRWRVVAIDLDGTVVRGTTVCCYLADWLGHRDIVDDLEGRFASGEIGNREVADGDAVHFRGVAAADVTATMASIPCIGDVSPAVEAVRTSGAHAVLCTLAWTFAVDALASRFGFHAYSGTAMDVDESGRLSGTVSSYFEPEDKVSYVRDYAARLGAPLSSVVAVGDGRSDIPLFRAVGYSVALNATPEARAAATVAVDSNSLLEALRNVPGLLSPGLARSHAS